MKPITIKICQGNEGAKHIAQIEELATQYNNIQVVIEQCLNRCSFCEDTPYVLVNNGVEFGDDMEELIEAIDESIQRIRK